MIDVSANDFRKLYRGVIRMLRALEQAGPAGLPTNKAGLQVFNSRTYGGRILREAESLGYIERKQVPMPKGKGGHYYIMNHLLPKGRELLQELGGDE
jgi:hypothetical protein